MKNKENNLFKLHERSVIWISELEFMKDEQVFLEHLLSMHFLDLSTERLYDTTSKLIRKLKDIESVGLELTNKVQHHHDQIALALERSEFSMENQLKKDHKALKKDIEIYTLKFRVVKKKIFGIVKDIMQHHKQKLLINKI